MTEDYTDDPTKLVKNKPTIERRVAEVMEEYPQATGDDMILAFRYYKTFSPNVRISFSKFSDLLSCVCFESISRARRKIQARERKLIEMGLKKESSLLPRERTRRKRRVAEEMNRAYYGNGQAKLEGWA
jgi:hypothetical protein